MRLALQVSRGSANGGGRGPFGPAVLDPVTEPARHVEQAVEVEIDPGARLLRHLVLDRQVEVVGAEVERAEGLLVLRQHRRADVPDVVEEDPAERDPSLVLVRRDLLAAQKDEVVRAAIAGGPLEGVLVRVAATGALDRANEVALDYARRARESLGAVPRRAELEALALAVVDRSG